MTGIAALASLFALALVAVSVAASRRRRRDLGQRTLAMATPGGRAFADHLGALSDFRMGLELPRRK